MSPELVIYGVVFLMCIRVRQDILKLGSSFLRKVFGEDEGLGEGCSVLDLPYIRFGDLQARRHRSVEEMCFVCSAEYGSGDVVSQLGRCGHVFHTECIGKVMKQRKQLNCPFCRSSVFNVQPSSNACDKLR